MADEHVKDLFFEALRVDKTQVRRFLESRCGDDAALIEQVEHLLRAHKAATGFMGSPTAAESEAGSATSGSEKLAAEELARIVNACPPGYEVRSEIHRGAQGVVWEAWHEATRRRVAIKTLKYGIDATPNQRLRFQREIELAASINHPGVVAVYDSGATEGDDPFVVMELVDGQPIDSYVRTIEATGAARQRAIATVMADICDAVQAAHQRGVIHRDLKPSNILIDEAGQVKVVDFGVAILAGDQLGDQAQVTRDGDFVGTFLYAAPEQVRGDRAAIDVRTDVYALGVLLYELLTGALPHDADSSLAELVQGILEETPRPPHLGEAHADPDLSAIAMQSLEKDQVLRYESVAAMRDDLRRFLSGQPVEARGRNAIYLYRKFVRRYWIPVVLTLSVMALLAVATVVSVVFAVQADRARDSEYEQKVLARQRAEELKNVVGLYSRMFRDVDLHVMGLGLLDSLKIELARRESEAGGVDGTGIGAEAETEAELLLLDQLGENVNLSNLARDLIDRYILASAGEALSSDMDPVNRAALHEAIGKTYYDLGLYERARASLETSLAVHRESTRQRPWLTAGTLSGLGGVALAEGRLDVAESYFTEALTLTRDVFGEDHPEMGVLLNNLGTVAKERGKLELAEDYYRRSLSGFARNHVDSIDAATSSINLASVLSTIGRWEEAREHYETGIAGMDRHSQRSPRALIARAGYGRHLVDLGQIERASPHVTAAYENCRRILSDSHPTTLSAMLTLSRVHFEQSDIAEAEQLAIEVVEGMKLLFGPDHPDLQQAEHHLALVLAGKGDLRASLGILKDLHARQSAQLGENHQLTLATVRALGTLMHDVGRYEQADLLLRRAYEQLMQQRGAGNRLTIVAQINLAAVHVSQREWEEARVLLRSALDAARTAFGGADRLAFHAMAELGRVLHQQGELDQARVYLETALDGRRRVLGDDHEDTISTVRNVGFLLRDMGRIQEAARYYAEALDGARRVLGRRHGQTFLAASGYGTMLAFFLDRPHDALEVYRTTLEDFGSVLPPEHPSMLSFQLGYAHALSLADEDEILEGVIRAGMEAARSVEGGTTGQYPPLLVSFESKLALLMRRRGELQKAETLITDTIAWSTEHLGAEATNTMTSRYNRGQILLDRGRLEEALVEMEAVVAWARETQPADGWRLAVDLTGLGEVLVAMGRNEQAEVVLLEAGETLARLFPEGHRRRVRNDEALTVARGNAPESSPQAEQAAGG